MVKNQMVSFAIRGDLKSLELRASVLFIIFEKVFSIGFIAVCVMLCK